jgi:hypothetical protein
MSPWGQGRDVIDTLIVEGRLQRVGTADLSTASLMDGQKGSWIRRPHW